MFFTRDKRAVNGFKQKRWTIEKLREKELKYWEAVVHSRYTYYHFWELENFPVQKITRKLSHQLKSAA